MKKAFVTLMSIMMMLIAVMGLAACGGKDDKPEKYDVAIRVGCSDGTAYEFPVGTDELHIEIPYDGVERKFGIRAYNLPDHPRWSDEWFDCAGASENYFFGNYWYKSPEGEYGDTRIIMEKGEYSIKYRTRNSSWNNRSVILYITVK